MFEGGQFNSLVPDGTFTSRPKKKHFEKSDECQLAGIMLVWIKARSIHKSRTMKQTNTYGNILIPNIKNTKLYSCLLTNDESICNYLLSPFDP